MPQLRDSGTRSLHATEPVPSAEMDGFCRIFGVETEYGVAVTGAERPVDAGQVAMTMFQPIVSRLPLHQHLSRPTARACT